MTFNKNTDPNKNAVVVFSGGQDSTACLFWALNNPDFDNVKAIFFDYGQRHRVAEAQAASIITDMMNVELTTIEISPDTLRSMSPLTSDNELEQYTDHTVLPGGLEKTFVPMRNQTFLTIAAAEAYRSHATNLVTGICQEDNEGYPDTRQEFVDAFVKTCNLGTFTGEDGALSALTIHTPLMNIDKNRTIKMIINFGYDAWLATAYSHTSYDGQYPPVGHDHATLLRQKGFEENGSPDPLVLRAHIDKGMELPDSSNYDFVRNLLRDRSYTDPEEFLKDVWEEMSVFGYFV